VERSKIIKYANGEWRDVAVQPYKDDDPRHRGVTRRELMGGDDEETLSFSVRYFEVAPGGFSTLERHEHTHAVMILRGSGTVVLGERVYAVAPHDCVYVAPDTLHQFQASEEEPLGFVCIVDRVRDRGIPAERADIEALLARGVLVKHGTRGDK
jgi:quercetin dioxygenase-like cupin family protein